MEILEDGVTGFLVVPGCVAVLAGATEAASGGAIVVAEARQKLARIQLTVEATMRQIQGAFAGLS